MIFEMKKYRASILTAIAMLLAFVANAESAESVMNKAADCIKKAKSVSADYTALANGDSLNGKIVISGEKFVLTSTAISTWFDGTTQWSYDSKSKEVNITEPTAEELQQINPFAIISSFQQSFKPMLLKAPKGQYKVNLTAKDKKADIKHAIVTFNASTYLPTEIQMDTPNGKLTIKVKNAAVGGALPLTTFRFDKAKYPKAKVVDLR